MRNTASGGKTSSRMSFSSRALVRLWPNGFSITTRRHAPAGGVGQAAALELLHHVRELARRDRQVERVVPAGAPLRVDLPHARDQLVDRPGVVERTGDEHA